MNCCTFAWCHFSSPSDVPKTRISQLPAVHSNCGQLPRALASGTLPLGGGGQGLKAQIANSLRSPSPPTVSASQYSQKFVQLQRIWLVRLCERSISPPTYEAISQITSGEIIALSTFAIRGWVAWTLRLTPRPKRVRVSVLCRFRVCQKLTRRGRLRSEETSLRSLDRFHPRKGMVLTVLKTASEPCTTSLYQRAACQQLWFLPISDRSIQTETAHLPLSRPRPSTRSVQKKCICEG